MVQLMAVRLFWLVVLIDVAGLPLARCLETRMKVGDSSMFLKPSDLLSPNELDALPGFSLPPNGRKLSLIQDPYQAVKRGFKRDLPSPPKRELDYKKDDSIAEGEYVKLNYGIGGDPGFPGAPGHAVPQSTQFPGRDGHLRNKRHGVEFFRDPPLAYHRPLPPVPTQASQGQGRAYRPLPPVPTQASQGQRVDGDSEGVYEVISTPTGGPPAARPPEARSSSKEGVYEIMHPVTPDFGGREAPEARPSTEEGVYEVMHPISQDSRGGGGSALNRKRYLRRAIRRKSLFKKH